MSTEERKAIVDNEFDLVKNAIYTDPEDQSAWLYELWLIGRGMALSVNAHEKRGNIHKAQWTNTTILMDNRGEEYLDSGRTCHLVPPSGDCCRL